VPVEEALDAALAADDSFAWIGLYEPTADEFESVARAFKLHPLAVEDAIKAQQRPKLEEYDDTLFAVFKTGRYLDGPERIEIGQVLLLLGEGFVVTVRHGETSALAAVRRQLEGAPDRLRAGPMAVLHAVADHVVDDYAIVLQGLGLDVEGIETQVFSDERGNHAERIYRLKREVLEFRHAVLPLAETMGMLSVEGNRWTPEPLLEYFRDVHDHVLRVRDDSDAVDSLLTSALNANLAQIGLRQNEDMRKISAWVALAAVPTMLAGIYGMNFQHMPELGWEFGYPGLLAVMAALCFALYRTFKRRGWL
jgi:magnesium transporter